MPDMRISRGPVARFKGQCAACGRTIYKGDPILRHIDTRKYVHATCQSRREPEAPRWSVAAWASDEEAM